MSITQNGIKINQRKKTGILLASFAILEIILSVFLYISLAAHTLFPQSTKANTGVAKVLSYQGRLTDTNGNPLGGSGTNYCFRFSIYDAATAGTKLWPSGTPLVSTTTVKDGVFNALVGEADTLTYNFYSNDTVFLNVEATSSLSGICYNQTSFETLSLRQRIAATGYAISAANVYSSLLQTDIANSKVQIGLGSGTSPDSQIKLTLDVVNTAAEYVGASCSTMPNGTLWYNSYAGITRALVCEAGLIQALSNATSTIAAIGVNGSIVSAGTVVFSNANNVTFGLAGSTITASANAGGGGATISHWPPFPVDLATISNYTGATSAGTNITASFHVAPLQLEQALAFTRINILASYVTTIAGTGSVSLAHMLGIYTLNNGTALSLSTSYMFRQEISQNESTARTFRWYWGTNSTSNSSSTGGNVGSLFNSFRVIPLFNLAAGNSLSAGQYFLAYAQTNRSSSLNAMPAATIMYISASQSALGALGQLGSAVTLPPFPLLGQFSSTTTAGNFTTPFMPVSINTTVITNTGGSTQWKWPFVNFLGK